ncbi:hypothetical protein C8Q78DRAFT_987475 [Trametes maxima]|nr:hypothetical protein C8Q78DRAFT_987475 [Trametes maxima]
MHEFVPELRYVPSGAHYDAQDEEYDVYYFWPSRNEFSRVPPPAFSTQWGDDSASEWTISDHSLPTSPTYSTDMRFTFPETVGDVDISNMGYSRFFRTGLWAQHLRVKSLQSSRITKRVDAFLAMAVAKIHSLKRRFSRQASSTNT